MTPVADAIAAVQALRPIRFPILLRFEIAQSISGDRTDGLLLTLELASEEANAGRLILSFEGVVDLKIDWPQWSLVRVDGIDLRDVSDRGLEGILIRVSEGSGFFAFSCREIAGHIAPRMGS